LSIFRHSRPKNNIKLGFFQIDLSSYKIRVDEILGPIFNNRIPKKEWPAHLEKLTDFWEMNLFGVARFKGNPSQKHVQLDVDLQNTIEAAHFEHWLNLWYSTIDELFTGERAEYAKCAAQRMGAAQLRVILSHRKII
jgi:hemoglobin